MLSTILRAGGVDVRSLRVRIDMFRHHFRVWRVHRRIRRMPPEDRRRLAYMLTAAVGEVERLLGP